MIIFVTPDKRNTYARYVHQYLKLRKKVFCDEYGWVSPNPDGTERDFLDDGYSIYILSIDTANDCTAGGVRVSPTTGPTLLHSCWCELLPDPDDFRSPNIWEATRFCVDDSQTTGRNKNFANRVTLALTLSILDFAAKNGISSIIAVCETRFIDLFGVYTEKPEVISSTTDENGCEISCVIWSSVEALAASLNWARPFHAGEEPTKLQAAE
ncbi:MAG: acyl-homoserine-lactone synthase [Pseudomonadota bacterium]